MPRYPYLNDDTSFDAASLNARFDVLAGALNTLEADSIAERALNNGHVPSVCSGVVTTETTDAVVTTPSKPGARILADRVDPYYTNSGLGYSLSLGTSYTLERRTDSTESTALMVMANVEVTEFADIEVVATDKIARGSGGSGGGPKNAVITGITLNEYEWDARVFIVLEDLAGTQKVLQRTERQLSPRVTIGNAGNAATPDPPVRSVGLDYLVGRITMSPLRDMPGHELQGPVYQQFDYKTYQDVAIRTVVTEADLSLLNMTNVAKILLGFKSGTDKRYYIQRANITAVPLLVEVV